MTRSRAAGCLLILVLLALAGLTAAARGRATYAQDVDKSPTHTLLTTPDYDATADALVQTAIAATATHWTRTPTPNLDATVQARVDAAMTATFAALMPTETPLLISVPGNEPPLPSFVFLGDDVRYEPQSWNNQGPANLSMALSYFGWDGNQATAAAWLKPNPDDKNVSPWQMVRFVNEQTPYHALYRVGGSVDVLRRVLAAGFPVIIERGFQPAGEDWLGHYLLLLGYDDATGHFLAFDSYLGSNGGTGFSHPYAELDAWWRHFNRTFIVVYDDAREADLRAALGDYADPQYGYEMALETAREEATQDSSDGWAWFNMGTAYIALGDYESAAIAYDQAFALNLPWRMLWYQFGPYEAYFHTGRYADVIALAETTQSIVANIEESYYWEGMAYAALGETEPTIRNILIALDYNPNFFPAQDALERIQNGTFTTPVPLPTRTPTPGSGLEIATIEPVATFTPVSPPATPTVPGLP
ncbi:MAG: tetratricopeptide repeat protein [Chloroflexi bacterium]|nr:tetratricopeptide repeat protein [Chloroflexota bacterium]